MTDTTAPPKADKWQIPLRELEAPIYDLVRLLRAATYLIDDSDEYLQSSARLLVDLAAIKAQALDDQ
ncbi:MAG: hypothetical protein JO136_06600 [Hyphomicrobiales bacterium]|nr:hypothetical protein [Hyphomicrobiales bacterium]MBV9907365.1 hypothetical protein [Hyphomicrobiales bacterium]